MARRTQAASSTASSSSLTPAAPTASTTTATPAGPAGGGPSSSASSSRLTRSSAIRASARATAVPSPAPTATPPPPPFTSITSTSLPPPTSAAATASTAAATATIPPRKQRKTPTHPVPSALTLSNHPTAVAASSAGAGATTGSTTATRESASSLSSSSAAAATTTSSSSTVRRSKRVKVAGEEKQQKELLKAQQQLQQQQQQQQHSRKRSATNASSSAASPAVNTSSAPATATTRSKRRKIHQAQLQSHVQLPAKDMSSGHHHRHHHKDRSHGSSTSRAAATAATAAASATSAAAAAAGAAAGKAELPTSPSSSRSKPSSHRHTSAHAHSRTSQSTKQQKQSASLAMSKHSAAAANKKDAATSQNIAPSRTSRRLPRRQPSDISMREAANDSFFHHSQLDNNDIEDDDNMDVEDDYELEEEFRSGSTGRTATSTQANRDRHRGNTTTNNNNNNNNENDDRRHNDDDYNHDDEDDDDDDDDDDDEAAMAAFQNDYNDLFGGAAGATSGAGSRANFQSTLRALSGFMSGTSLRLRDILANLRRPEDPSMQFIALQELSDLLLVSNEDNLIGQFSPDAYVRELVKLMQPNEITAEENPEIMLLACRSLANMMEALRGSVANVVYGGAVPILCQKLLDIQFIDLAEQALDTLAKISVDFPAAIVREGGLTACLTYLDFFPTSTQRTAVTTAANCCRNLSPDSFEVVRDVMPILLNVLNSNDQRVVEQGCTCVSRIVESFKRRPDQMGELIQPGLLKAVLRLLVPGTTNLIGPHVHTQLLRVLALTAKSSAKLSGELLKMGVVDTLYQILTGVSPPAMDDENAAAVDPAASSGASSPKVDSVHIMQALIHLPREQVFETLNVVCELLPKTPEDAYWENIYDNAKAHSHLSSSRSKRRSKHDHHQQLRKDPLADPRIKSRVAILNSLPNEVKRFAKILFPTLTDTYSSTVNQAVREKVLVAQMKMLLYLDAPVLEAALSDVSYASFLAAIFTQAQGKLYSFDQVDAASTTMLSFGFGPSASAYLIPVKLALQCAILLFKRLPGVYIYQFQREGVVAQVERITKWEMGSERRKKEKDEKGETAETEKKEKEGEEESDTDNGDDEADTSRRQQRDERGNDGDDDDEDEDDDYDDDDDDDDDDAESYMSSDVTDRDTRDIITTHHEQYQDQVISAAREFLRLYKESCSDTVHSQAVQVLETLKTLAHELRDWYLTPNNQQQSTYQPSGDGEGQGVRLFKKLAEYFNDHDKFESITSAELLESGIVRVLLDVLGARRNSPASSAKYTPDSTVDAQADFLAAFMGSSEKEKVSGILTPFSVLTHKLHDLLSRTENFEVITTGGSSSPYSGSSSSGGIGGATDSSYSRSSAIAMLAKQLRIKLIADDAGEGNEKEGDCPAIPKQYRNLIVSIHAIANFKTLDDYLRPRLILSDRPRRSQTGSGAGSRNASAGAPPLARGSGGSDLTHQRHHHRHGGHHHKSHTDASKFDGDELSDSRRRSSRRHHQGPPSAPELSQDEVSCEDDEEQLECADEKRLSEDEPDNKDEGKPEEYGPDDEDEDIDDEDALDALVDDFEGDMSDDGMPPRDPSAVNVEVGSSGSVTAKREDGTRVSTPRTSTPAAASRPTAAQPPNPYSGAESSAAATADRLLAGMFGGRSFASYAAALAAIPQDWHLEFRMNGKILRGDTTIYRAVHQARQPESQDKNVFGDVHTIHYRRVPGPPSPEPSTLHEEQTTEERAKKTDENGMPQSLLQNHTVASILQLLRALHSMNSQLADIQTESNIAVRLEPEALTQFINTKLTAKLNRQLEEPLIVASKCLPEWSEDLARQFPFLFPFETRHMFLQSTSFGYSRALMRWQQADDSRRDSRHDESPVLGRLSRQKVRISRSRILESAHKVMDLYGSSANVLEVEYFEEVGTGLGPTLEFYSTVSKEFSSKKLKMWREQDSDPASEYVFSKSGLFPAPMSPKDARKGGPNNQLEGFKVLGKFVARSMLDSRIIDVPFSATFFRLANQSASLIPTIGTIKSIDPTLANSLLYIKKFANAKARIEQDTLLSSAEKDQALSEVVIDDARIEDLGLDFTLPGYPNIDLVPGGSSIPLTLENVALYLERVIDLTLGSGVVAQMQAFRTGFSEVFPYSAMQSFTPDELVMLFGRTEEDWSIETLTDSMKADHGFNMDSKSVRNLLQVMSEFTIQQRRDFLQFVTGSPKLPIGGFRSLTPIFTVVCRPSEPPFMPDDYLPSVMTCVNYLKLPDYSSIEVLAARLNVAMSEGQGAFHLS